MSEKESQLYLLKKLTEREHWDIGKLLEPSQEWPEFTVKQTENVIAIVASPGNGTKYRILITELSPELQDFLETAKYVVHVPFSRHKTNWWLGLSDFDQIIHPSYVAEKLGINLPDACCISGILYRAWEMGAIFGKKPAI